MGLWLISPSVTSFQIYGRELAWATALVSLWLHQPALRHSAGEPRQAEHAHGCGCSPAHILEFCIRMQLGYLDLFRSYFQDPTRAFSLGLVITSHHRGQTLLSALLDIL